MQERTSYLAQGDDGKQLLKEGPILNKYRGLNVVKSRAFSMEEGGAPRDVLRRRVRTAEFYYGECTRRAPDPEREGVFVNEGVLLYDEFTDNFVKITCSNLIDACGGLGVNCQTLKDATDPVVINECTNWLLVRPCIEHYMLAAIIGRGGLQHLGATLWGQTELSVFDDGQHGKFRETHA